VAPRGRPNLAARVTIVLATAAAVALLGVAGLRWQQDSEAPASHATRSAEWPSSEGTAPVHATDTPSPSPAPTSAPGVSAAPAEGERKPAETKAAESEGRAAETEAAPSRKTQAFPVSPPVKVVRIDGSDRRRAEARVEQESSRASAAVDARGEVGRPPRARETSVASPGASAAATSPPPSAVVATSPARTEPKAQAAMDPRPETAPPQPPAFKPAPRKDDPDSTLPLDE